MSGIFSSALLTAVCLAVSATAFAADRSNYEPVDTTPPRVYAARPAPDSTVSGAVAIQAKFADEGSGIDPASVKLLLDGQDVTRRAGISAEGITLKTPEPLAKGIHDVTIEVSDRAGNAGNRLQWHFGVDVPVAVKARFKDGLFLVNDRPFLPIGLYCGATSPHRRDRRYLIEAAEAGVNCHLVGDATDRNQLDVLLGYGVKALINLWYPIKAFGKNHPEKLERLLRRGDHPAVLGWYAEFPNTDPEPIKLYGRVARTIRRKDPDHPVLWICSWASHYKQHFATSDAAIPYFYPILNANYKVVDLYERSLVPAFAALKGQHKQVWFLTQAFDYRIDRDRQKILEPPDEFRPTVAELRAINYLTLAEGIQGIVFYAPGSPVKGKDFYNDITHYPTRWEACLRIASELRYLAPILAAGKVDASVRLDPPEAAIHYRGLRHDGRRILIAVNVASRPITVHWRFDNPVRPKVLFEDRVAVRAGRVLRDDFEPLQVHVYGWTSKSPTTTGSPASGKPR